MKGMKGINRLSDSVLAGSLIARARCEAIDERGARTAPGPRGRRDALVSESKKSLPVSLLGPQAWAIGLGAPPLAPQKKHMCAKMLPGLLPPTPPTCLTTSEPHEPRRESSN